MINRISIASVKRFSTHKVQLKMYYLIKCYYGANELKQFLIRLPSNKSQLHYKCWQVSQRENRYKKTGVTK